MRAGFPILCAVVAPLAALLVASSAFAGPVSEAERRFQSGVALAEEGRWDVALVEFRASLAEKPTRAAALNAAICLEKLARYPEAVVTLEGVLADRSLAFTAADVDALKAKLESLRDLVGDVLVTANVVGAEVLVDGVVRGRIPLDAPLAVGAGARAIRVEAPGYIPFLRVLDVTGRTRIVVPTVLTPLAATTHEAPAEEPRRETVEIIGPGYVPAAEPHSSAGVQVGLGLGGEVRRDFTTAFASGEVGARVYRGLYTHLGGSVLLAGRPGFGVEGGVGYMHAPESHGALLEGLLGYRHTTEGYTPENATEFGGSIGYHVKLGPHFRLVPRVTLAYASVTRGGRDATDSWVARGGMTLFFTADRPVE